MASVQPIDNFLYGNEDDPTLRAQLVEVANLLWCTNGPQNEWISYFNNPANIAGLKEARARYGIPPKNRPSWRSSGLFGKWHDYCDWGDVYRFWYYAKIAQDFPSLNADFKGNCYVINGYIKGLEAERVNAEKAFAATGDAERHNRQLEVLAEKINDMNSLYASMSCDNYIAEQDRIRVAQERAKALQQSSASNIQVFQATAGASGGGTKLAIYVFGGVAALVALMIVFKKKRA